MPKNVSPGVVPTPVSAVDSNGDPLQGTLPSDSIRSLTAVRQQMQQLIVARSVDAVLRSLPGTVRWLPIDGGVRLVLPEQHRVDMNEVHQRATMLRESLGLTVEIAVLPGVEWRQIPARISKTDRDGHRIAQLRKDILQLIPRGWNPSVDLAPGVVTVTCGGHIVTADERQLLSQQIEARFGLLAQIRTEFSKGSAYKAIRASMPPGIQVWRAQVSQLVLSTGTRDVLGLWCHAPEEKIPTFQRWQADVERHTGAIIIPNFETAPKQLRTRLLSLLDVDVKERVITDPVRVQSAAREFYGPEPTEEPDQIPSFPSSLPREKEDRRMITIDSAVARTPQQRGLDGAELPAANIEDGLWARVLPNGNVKVCVYIIDAAWRVRPGSPWAERAERAKFSLFAGEHSVHMLGTRLSFQELSLHERLDRVVWRIGFEVTPEGERVHTNVRRIIAQAAGNFSPQEVDVGMGEGSFPFREEYQALQLSAHRLRGSAQRKARSVAPSDSAVVVEEHMIAAVQAVAEQLQARGVAAPFRIHGVLTSRQRNRLVARIRACGIPVSAADLADVDRGIAIAEQLLKHPDGSRIGHTLLSSHLYRSQFHPIAGKHAGLKVDAYTQLKACRSFPALIVQWLMESTFDPGQGAGAGIPPLSPAEVAAKTDAVNEHLRSQHQLRWELYRLASLANNLRLVGDLMRAEVLSVRGKEVRARVMGTEIEGRVRAEPYERAEMHVGRVIPVRLRGYHARRLEYVFSYESDLMHAVRARAEERREDPEP